MGTYLEEQEYLRHCERNKEDFEFRIVEIKKIFNIPVLFVKQSKYEKIYSLFNILNLITIVSSEEIEKAEN